jgi:hypothetical protein
MDNDYAAEILQATEGMPLTVALTALTQTLADLAASIDAIEGVAQAQVLGADLNPTIGGQLATIYLMTQYAKQVGDKRPEITVDELVAKVGVSREDAQLALDRMHRSFDTVERQERDGAVKAVEGLLNL